MAETITLDELFKKMSNPATTEKDIAPYFEIDPKLSSPFKPVVAINPAKVRLPTDVTEARARSALLLNLFNRWARSKRDDRFAEKIGSGYKGPIIVSEGDSWFQYPLRLQDVIDHLMEHFAVKSLDAAGDTLDQMLEQDEYISRIIDTRASVFLLSGGGNDLLSDGQLAGHLKRYDPALSAAQHLRPSFDSLVGSAIVNFETIFRRLELEAPNVHTFCHGYDFPLPDGGPWLGAPMQSREIVDPTLQKAIAREMMMRFNAALAKTASHFEDVTYVDCRGVVGTRWFDELHPSDNGYADVAAKFKTGIDALGIPKSMAAAGAKSKAKPKLDKKRAALSLHIGLNHVDGNHYKDIDGSPWDGRLEQCVNDANSMKQLATLEGFTPTQLLNEKATRKAVLDYLSDAAAQLRSGDTLLITYSGHGGQLPDFNGDEKDDGKDETWVLFNMETADDELYLAWSKFREGVRIVLLSDSCHSGSVAKAQKKTAVAETSVGKFRAMPHQVATMTARIHDKLYRDIGKALPKLERQPGETSIKSPLACTVLLISGCQDDQLSYESIGNGRFTQELLNVWDGGSFKGSYRQFHKAIQERMPNNQRPNYMVIGQPDLAFESQRPFKP
jgi:metacaspase-1